MIEDWREAWDIGDECRFGCEARSLDPEMLTDPTVLVAQVLDETNNARMMYAWPAGQDIVRDSAGVFHLDVTFTGAGRWWIRWQATGAIVAAEERSVTVRPSKFR